MASSSGSAAAATTGTKFPWRPALAIATAFALLFLWHRFKDPATGLYPGIFADAFRLQLRHHAADHAGHKTPAVKAPSTTLPGGRPPISPYLIDDSGALDPFFAALHELESSKTGAPQDPRANGSNGNQPSVPNDNQPSGLQDNQTASGPENSAGSSAPVSKPGVVTILHYGDSPTTADLITGDARALLQARFGDAGHGFNLIAKPWAWYGHRDVNISDHGWKSLTGVGSMRNSLYGLGGARFEGEAGAHSTFRLADAAQTEVELQYFTEPNGGSVNVTADGNTLQAVDTHGDANVPSAVTIRLPAGTKEVGLNAVGPVTLLGVDFRRGDRGVIYDSLGLNGASTTVLSRTFDLTAWTAELQHAAPNLVVINYGTNESSFGAFVDKQYEGELRLAVARVRKALPSVPILIMSPMDRGERAGLNEIHTMETIPRIIAIQQRVAADLHCAFFDTFDAMGGDGTMSDWYNGKPRLVSADLIHPTPQGALIVAQEFVDNLNLGYARWEHMNGIVSSQPVVAPTACRPVTPSKEAPIAPPGTVAAPNEPLPATGAPSTGSTQAHPLPPCPAPPSKLQPAKAGKPSASIPSADHLPSLAAVPSVSGDTEKNDRSNAGKDAPVSAPHR